MQGSGSVGVSGGRESPAPKPQKHKNTKIKYFALVQRTHNRFPSEVQEDPPLQASSYAPVLAITGHEAGIVPLQREAQHYLPMSPHVLCSAGLICPGDLA